MDFSELSISLTNNISKEIKKNEGIYFTPNNIIKKIIDYVLDIKPDIETILEPSCGSCQFIDYLNEKGKNSIVGIEKNSIIYNSISIIKKNSIIINADFLDYHFETSFDLIIGNPPYFVIPKKTVDKKYLSLFDGRPNIYILFIIKSFELLNDNGILALVLPTNFLNCIYYNKLRKHLSKYTILDIYYSNELFSEHKFLDTCQEVCIFIIQKKINTTNSKFCINFNEYLLFKNVNEIEKISILLENTTTLHKLGFTMNIGTVVWNQCKGDLTDDKSKTLLIYSNDIKNNNLDIQKYKNTDKKNYINKKGNNDIKLLVNRGYGTGKYSFNYILIESVKDYLVENHLIVISHPSNDKEQFIPIINSFKNEKTHEFINLVFSNNAINIQEFLHILPIYF